MTWRPTYPRMRPTNVRARGCVRRLTTQRRRRRLRPSGQGAREAIDQRSRARSITIERRVEDGDLESTGSAAAERDSEHHLQFGPTQSAREAVVNRGHHIVVQDVDVEVDPESREAIAVEMID